MLDVYSITVPSDVVHEKGFALWRRGDGGSHEYSAGNSEIYPLDGPSGYR